MPSVTGLSLCAAAGVDGRYLLEVFVCGFNLSSHQHTGLSTCPIWCPAAHAVAAQVFAHSSSLPVGERNAIVTQRWHLLEAALKLEKELHPEGALAKSMMGCRSTKQAIKVRLSQAVNVSATLTKQSQAVQALKQQVEAQAEAAKVDGDKGGYEMLCSVFSKLRSINNKLVQLAAKHSMQQQLLASTQQKKVPALQHRAERQRETLDSDLLSILQPNPGEGAQQQQGQGQQQPLLPQVSDHFAQAGWSGCAVLTPQQTLLLQQGGSSAVSADGSSTLRQLATTAFREAAAGVFRMAGDVGAKDASLRVRLQQHLAPALRVPQAVASGGAVPHPATAFDAGSCDGDAAAQGAAAAAAAGRASAQGAAAAAAAGDATAQGAAAAAAAGRAAAQGAAPAAAAGDAAASGDAAAVGGADGAAPRSSAGAVGSAVPADAWPPQLPRDPMAVAALVADMLVQSYDARSAWGLLWDGVVTDVDPVAAAALQQV